MKNFEYPSFAELYALELQAHRERSRLMAQLLVAGASAVKSFFARGLAIALGGPSARTQLVRERVVHRA